MNQENDSQIPCEEEQADVSSKKSASVYVYLAVLFGAAFLLLLFSYLMQQRDSEEIMGNLSQLRESLGGIQSIDQLVEENRNLRDEIASLKNEVAELNAARQQQNNEMTALQEQASADKITLQAEQERVRALEEELKSLREQMEPPEEDEPAAEGVE